MTKRQPTFGEEIDVYDIDDNVWVPAKVSLVLSSQFTYLTVEDDRHGIMLFNSETWRHRLK